MKRCMILILLCALGVGIESNGMQNRTMNGVETTEWQQLESSYKELNQRALNILTQAQPTIEKIKKASMRTPPQLLIKNPLFEATYTEIKDRKTTISTLQKNLSDLHYKITQFKNKLSREKVTPPDQLKKLLDNLSKIRKRVTFHSDDIQIKLETLEGIRERSTKISSMPTSQPKEVWHQEPKVKVKPLIDIDRADALINEFKISHPDLDDARLKQKIFLASLPSHIKQKHDPKEGSAKIDPSKESNRTEAIALIDEYIRTHAQEELSRLEEVKMILESYDFKHKSEETLSTLRKQKRESQKEQE